MSEENYIKYVCPYCNYTTCSPNNFLNRMQFWKYKTVHKPCADIMDCIRMLKEEIKFLRRKSKRDYPRLDRHCPYCPHCNRVPTTV